ncbi:MAG: hypothetical protein N2249_02315 [Melioribacter sp.]|nr:hypothetical protein [Melioribacter sp.]
MTKGIRFFFFILLFTNFCFAQIKPGAREASLSFSNITTQDAFSIFYNPSVISDYVDKTIGFSYAPAPFELKELSTTYLTFIYPTSIGNFSTGLMVYGFELYKETQFALAYSNYLTKSFSFGITSIYKNLSIKNYGNKGYILFNLGGKVNINKNLTIGFFVENFTRTSIKYEDNQFPIVMNLGISYQPVNELNIFAALHKDINYDFAFSIGTEYNITDFLSLRIGTSNLSNEYSGGFGLKYNLLTLEYALLSHSELGITHQFGLVLNF